MGVLKTVLMKMDGFAQKDYPVNLFVEISYELAQKFVMMMILMMVRDVYLIA